MSVRASRERGRIGALLAWSQSCGMRAQQAFCTVCGWEWQVAGCADVHLEGGRVEHGNGTTKLLHCLSCRRTPHTLS